MEESLDHNKELPENFLSEIYKWALECKYPQKNEFFINESFFSQL